MEELNRILGNDAIKNYFRSAIEHDRVSHAYIFEGEKGCGKKLMTEIFAKTLQCEGEQKPCGKCSSCLQIAHHNHPDVIWVKHEKANLIKVEDIRDQLINTIDIRPYKGPYKIYIIDEAEKMNIQAQNAILKTIEEPNGYAILFLLTQSRGAFLPTILSRCITMSVKPVSTGQIKAYLTQKEGIDAGRADFYAGFSMGNLGKAISMANSEEFNELRNHAIHLLRNLHESSADELDGRAKECKEFKENMADYFDIMRMWFRDLLIWKTTKSSEKIIFRDQMSILSRQEKLLSLEAIPKIFDAIDRCDRQWKAYVNFEPSLTVMFLSIRRSFQD